EVPGVELAVEVGLAILAHDDAAREVIDLVDVTVAIEVRFAAADGAVRVEVDERIGLVVVVQVDHTAYFAAAGPHAQDVGRAGSGVAGASRSPGSSFVARC